MPYSQESAHSVTDGLTRTMLLIGIPLVVTCWRNFIHSWRFWRCHGWSRCGPHFLPLFSKWLSWLNKYRAGGMTCDAWFSFQINNYSVSVLIFVEANDSFMSLVQTVCYCFGRNNLREWAFMYHPRHVLCSTSLPSPTIFLKDIGSSRFMGSDVYSGRKSVWMTNRSALFARSIQCSSSTVMVMMSSMNLSIYASVAVMYTDKGSAVARWLVECCFSSWGSRYRCGEFRSSMSQYLYRSRSFHRSIATSLTVVYSFGANMVPKDNHR